MVTAHCRMWRLIYIFYGIKKVSAALVCCVFILAKKGLIFCHVIVHYYICSSQWPQIAYWPELEINGISGTLEYLLGIPSPHLSEDTLQNDQFFKIKISINNVEKKENFSDFYIILKAIFLIYLNLWKRFVFYDRLKNRGCIIFV